MMRYLILLCCLLCCFPAQAQYEDVTITTTQVNGPVYMLEGRGGNLGVFIGFIYCSLQSD